MNYEIILYEKSDGSCPLNEFIDSLDPQMKGIGKYEMGRC